MIRMHTPIARALATGALVALAVIVTAGTVAAQPTVLATLQGDADGDFFGTSVAAAGDLDGDGKDDIVVGAPWADTFGTDSGAAYVYYGGSPPVAGPVLQGYGVNGSEIGYSVGSAGRFDDDGYDDLVVCQRGIQSQASIYLGGGPMPNGFQYTMVPTYPGTSNIDTEAWYTFCHSVASTDFNGDGMDDVIIGAPLYQDGYRAAAGRAYLYFGRSLPTSVEMPADHVLDAGAHQEFGGRFGTSVVGLDFNNDGYGDFAVGAPGSLKVLLFLGSASGVPGTPLVFSEPVGGFGNALASGDLNWDTRDDLVVGAADDYYTASAESGVFRYFGGSSPDTVEDGYYRATQDWTQYGWSVAVLDPENDGYDNLMIGDPSWEYDPNVGYYDQGRVYDAGKGFRFDGNAWVDRFGHVLAALGDVNGDGKEDFAVGAPQGWYDPGYVRIYRGYTPNTQPCRKCPDIGDGTPGEP